MLKRLEKTTWNNPHTGGFVRPAQRAPLRKSVVCVHNFYPCSVTGMTGFRKKLNRVSGTAKEGRGGKNRKGKGLIPAAWPASRHGEYLS